MAQKSSQKAQKSQKSTGIGKCLQLMLYACCLVCGIVTAALVVSVQVENEGKCLLYGIVRYEDPNYQPRLNSSLPGPADTCINGAHMYPRNVLNVTSSSDPFLCHFVTAISAGAAIFCFFLILSVVCSCRAKRGCRRAVMLGLCVHFVILLLITGCILKVGRDQLCKSVSQAGFCRCDDAQKVNWDNSTSGSQFYSYILSAEISVWVSLVCLLISGLMVFARRSNKQKERKSHSAVPTSPPSEP